MPAAEPPCIAFFAHERGDARVARRIAGFHDQGWESLGFMFHRDRGKIDVLPPWENIELGTTYNRRYFHRVWTLAKSALILWRERARLADCALIYVINTDNAVLALLGRLFCGREIPLVLELADIQPVMTGDGLIAKGLRAIERAVLKRSALLVTTSPGFVRHYFEAVQQFRGRIFLLENKVYPSAGLPEVPAKTRPLHDGRPWVIGYFGAFRCRRSMQLIHALASRLGDRVRFQLRGYASGVITEEFPRLLGNLPNLVFDGPYDYPSDLAALYEGVDFNWCFDEADPSGNSRWLLPNRIYEGGCFKVPALSAESSETGRWIAGHACGWGFVEPLEEDFVKFFESVTVEEWTAIAGNCAEIPPDHCRGEADYTELVATLRELVAGS